MIDERPSLYSMEAEEAVLGALLLEKTAIVRVANILSPDSFFSDRNSLIYKAALAISQRNEAIDLVTLYDELSNNQKLDAAGVADYLGRLYCQTVTASNIEDYAKIINKYEQKRKLLAASVEIARLAYEDDVDSAKAKAMGLLMAKGLDDDRSMTPNDRAEFAAKRYYELKDARNTSLITFGFPTLDTVGGMSGGDTIMFGGDTKKGKTTCIHQIARHVGATYGPVRIFTLEMSDREMVDRDTARLTKRSIPVIQRGQYGDGLYEDIMASIPKFKSDNLFYDFPVHCTVPMIYYAAKRQQIEYGLVLVIVDYVQLLHDTARFESESVKYSNIAHDLKDVARELDVPIIEVSQYSRAIGDDNHRYKWSSAWEQDASWLLHYSVEKTDEVDDKGNKKEKAFLSIGGGRQRGPVAVGKIELEYMWETQSFKESADVKQTTDEIEDFLKG